MATRAQATLASPGGSQDWLALKGNIQGSAMSYVGHERIKGRNLKPVVTDEDVVRSSVATLP